MNDLKNTRIPEITRGHLDCVNVNVDCVMCKTVRTFFGTLRPLEKYEVSLASPVSPIILSLTFF